VTDSKPKLDEPLIVEEKNDIVDELLKADLMGVG